MTYPDKTVYPVASCNDKDFQNLMDVYMDAVLHPNIYKEEKIFRQESWHYEMESADSPITVNGVVYNEMKGAFSSPEGVLDRYTQNTLYPDICAKVSGARGYPGLSLRIYVSTANSTIRPTALSICTEIWIWQRSWTGWIVSI